MACFKPIEAYKAKAGGITFDRREGYTDIPPVKLPCGRCTGCRIDRSRMWAARCVHEAQLYDENSFLTLTYRSEDLPRAGTLVPRHFTLFAKRLRKHLGSKRVRYFHCGEYGDDNSRPHYHALLFGHDFPDKKFHKNNFQGDPIFTSKVLDDLWQLGHCYLGAVTFESAAYVARYVMKKITGDLANHFYQALDPDTGELVPIVPEYMTCSRGIGRGWFERFSSDVFPSDFLVVDGRKIPVPRFYEKLLKRQDADALAAVKSKRRKTAVNPKTILKRVRNSRPKRLVVRETVVKSRLNLSKRNHHGDD